MEHFPNLITWFGSSVVGLILLWLREADKSRATLLTLITILPALLAGPLFLIMVLGRVFLGPVSRRIPTKVKQS